MGPPSRSRRHDEDGEIFAQMPAGVERERQAEIGVETALVELVEHDETRTLERRIVVEDAEEYALGQDLDACARANARVEAGPIANRLAHILAQHFCHALRGGPCRQAARFEHEDRSGAEPLRIEEREGDQGCLAGAGWGLEHGRTALAERFAQRRQGLGDR